MITTELDRYEFTASSSTISNPVVFRSGGTDIPIRNTAHVKVHITTTEDFTTVFATSTVNLLDTGHGHLDGETITLSSATSLPTGLLANTVYYVVNKATNTFQVSLSLAGSAVAFSSNGSGTLTWTKTLLKAISTDYTVALVGTTATITWVNAPSVGDKVLFLRDVTFEQTTDLQNNSQFEAESVEGQLDLMVNMSQQLKNNSDRQLKFSSVLIASDATEASATLTATSAGRANKSLKFDSLGNLGVTTINVDNAQDYTLEAQSWATESPAVVNTYSETVASPISSTYSAKEHAVGTPPDGSSKEWATTDTVAVAGGLFSAKQYAANAAISETSANASADAVAVMYDAFNDKYLGSMADGATQGTNPTTNGTWGKNSSSIVVVSATNIKVGQVVTGTGMPTSPKPNVISIASTTVVLSDNMAALGSAVALTFTGHGIYGTFNGTKDGPALDNDGDALSDGLLYFNTTDDVMKVYDETSSTWKQLTPTSSEQTNINAAVADAVDIGVVAGLNTEIGRLGSTAYADGATAYLALLGTSAMAHASTGNIKKVADIQANVTTVAGISANVTTVAGISANVTTVAGVSGNVTTVATNIAGVNDFALRYRVGTSDPSSANDAGDLFWNSTSNQFKVYNATTSTWVQPYLTSANVDTIANNAAVAMSIALG